jgi:hypothetical protein
MTLWEWILVAVLVTVYVATSVRVALAAGRLGRSPVRWLLITLGLTAIPAMVCFWRDVRRRRGEPPPEPGAPAPPGRPPRTSPPVAPGDSTGHAGGLVRCPNCNAMIDSTELAGLPLKTCPRCHLPIEKVYLA